MSNYMICQAVDPAVGLSSRADFFSMATGCLDFPTRKFHLLDIHKARYETTEQPAIVTREYRKWAGPNFYCVGVESLFAQSDLFKHLRTEALIPIKEIARRSGTGNAGMSKYLRMLGLAGHYERGDILHPGTLDRGVWVPDYATHPWLEDYEAELLSLNWVDGKETHNHDDMADSVAMCCDLLFAVLLASATSQPPQYSSFSYS